MNGSDNWYFGEDDRYADRNKGASKNDGYRPAQSSYNAYSRGGDSRGEYRTDPRAEPYGNDSGDPYSQRRTDVDNQYGGGRYEARNDPFNKRQSAMREDSPRPDPRGMEDPYNNGRYVKADHPRNRESGSRDAYYKDRRDNMMYAGQGVNPQIPIRPLDVSRSRGASTDPSVLYELDHLATFSVSPKLGLSTPDDGIRRLRTMEKSTGVWAMRVQIRIDRRELIITELATQEEIECFPISRIQECIPVIAKPGSVEPYNNIVIFVVQGDKKSAAEMNIFQCIGCTAEDVVDDINAARAGKFPRPPRATRVEPLLLYDTPSPRSQSSRSGADDPYFRNDSVQKPPGSNKPKPAVEDDLADADVNLMNRCFDDIERFVTSLQEAANVQKEMERLRLKNNTEPSEMLRLKARPPPKNEFIDTLQKFKLVLNLLPRLKNVLRNPDATELLHSLFGPLAVTVTSSSDDKGIPMLARSIESPLLTGDTCEMLNNYLNAREMELWRSLGQAWTTPSYLWRGATPPPYSPVFANGWKPSVQQINSACHMLPPASGYRDRSVAEQQTKPANGTRPKSQENAYPVQQENPPPARPPPQEQPASSGSQQSNQSSPLGTDSASQMYVVTTSREGKNLKELSVTAGEKVELLDGSKNWWKVRNSSNVTGFVPKTLLKPAEN